MKLKKMPKRPKHSAGLKAWENYHKKVADRKKYNSKVGTDKAKKQRLIDKRVN